MAAGHSASALISCNAAGGRSRDRPMLTEEEKRASARRREANRELGRSRDYERVRARPIHPGRRVMVTRRCLERRMFLTPGKSPEETRNFIGYSLGVALQNTETDLHQSVCLGNHHHSLLTDNKGNLPDFKCSFHGNVARGLNAKHGRFDKFWSADGSCDTVRPSDDETLEDMVYILVNAVAAGLVKWGDRWPGFTTYGWRFGETRRYWRPKWYFDPNNAEMPDYVDITLERPSIFHELSDDELYEKLMKRVRERELEIQADMRRRGRRFAGEAKLRKQYWNNQPRTVDPRFTRTPKVAASSRWLRLAQLQRDRAWEREYAVAREEQREGGRPVFPAGTFWMRRHAGVRVATGPP